MKKYLTLLSLLLPLSSFAYDVEKEVMGEGETKEQAIQAGLTEAVRQHFGVSVVSASVDVLTSVNDEVNETASSSNLHAFKGVVKSYDILDTSKSNDGYEVTLNVVLKVDEKKVAEDKIADRNTMALSIKGKYASKFESSAESYFVAARKFAIVRDQKKARFLLEVDVKKAYTTKKKTIKHIKLTNEEKVTYKTNSMFEINYKVLDQLTGQVVSSDIQKTVSNKDNLSLLIEKYATEKLYKAINEAVSPVRVVGLIEDRIIMGEGGKNIVVGELYEVFSMGEEMFDPYTGASLGSSETKVATVKVTKVLPKMSEAKVISGQIKSISKYDIMRKAKSEPVYKHKKKKEISENKSSVGGIIL